MKYTETETETGSKWQGWMLDVGWIHGGVGGMARALSMDEDPIAEREGCGGRFTFDRGSLGHCHCHAYTNKTHIFDEGQRDTETL